MTPPIDLAAPPVDRRLEPLTRHMAHGKPAGADPFVRVDEQGNVRVLAAPGALGDAGKFIVHKAGRADLWTPEDKAEFLADSATQLLAAMGLQAAGGAAGSWTFYNGFRLRLGDGTHDMDTHTFKLGLSTSTYTPSATTHVTISDITNELSGSGYARATLASVTWSQSGATVTWDCADVVFTASGGSITARYAWIFNDTPTSPADPLVCYLLLDTTPADVTATDGNTLTVQMAGTGVFTLT